MAMKIIRSNSEARSESMYTLGDRLYTDPTGTEIVKVDHKGPKIILGDEGQEITRAKAIQLGLVKKYDPKVEAKAKAKAKAEAEAKTEAKAKAKAEKEAKAKNDKKAPPPANKGKK